ncbi:MAG: DUF4062 domain-containing protein, partial [Planctomycetota bacterium]|nr:DUF4062 domain-containing protein [Planctomycetota bacterium]
MIETERSKGSRPELQRCLNTRRIVLFVSSTFRDLQDERDELCLRVFPRIRTFCRQRSVTFSEIDLRWGITVDQAEGQQILSRCFQEIGRSQPFFLGIIGERYGWVPRIGDGIPESSVLAHPWLRDHVGESVTELEFRHGVFNQTDGHDYAWFYSRERADAAARAGMDLDSRDDESRTRLVALKRHLRASGGHFREGFATPQTLGEWVYDDLTTAIAKLFPDAAMNEPLRHLSEARHCQVGFAGREKEMARLEHLQARRGRCVVIAGEAGSGKTSLLANWFCGRAETAASHGTSAPSTNWVQRFLSFKTARRSRPRIDVIRFAQLSPDSVSSGQVALSVIRELRERLSLDRVLPSDPASALAEFPGWLAEAGRIADVRLVIAKLDRLEPDPERASVLLPSPAPRGVSIVVSVGDASAGSDYAVRLSEAGWHVLTPGPMSDGDLQLAIELTLAHYGKQLARPDEILRRMSSRLPGFMRTFLETIRLHGEFGEHGELLDERIDWFLHSANDVELYERVVEKWQTDFEGDYPGLVRLGFSLVLVSHSGLDETEVLELLGDGTRPLPRFAWTPLQAFAERNLCQADGRLRISAGPFRMALQRTFAIDDRAERELRDRLIDYFRRQPVSTRHIDELLWQLAAVELWDELADWLASPAHIHQFWPTHEFVLKHYCQQLRERTGHGIEERLRDNLTTQYVPVDVAMTACQLLFDLGEKTAVEQVLAELRQRVTDFDDELRRRLIAMLASVCLFNRPEESLTLLHEEEALCHKIRNRTALAACIGNQATALRQCNRLAEARERHIIEETLCRELNDLRLLAGSLNNQAQIGILAQEHESAASYLPELETLARTLRDSRLIGSCHEIRGVCLSARNKHAEAVRSLSQAVNAYQEAIDHGALAHCLLRLSAAYYQLGDLDAALASLDRGEGAASTAGVAELAAEFGRERNRLLNQ